MDEVAEIVQGQSPPGSSYNTDARGTPFFQGKSEFGDLYPTVAKWTTLPKKRAKEGDVLLSVRAPVGPTNLAPVDCAIGRGITAVHPLTGMDPKYLLYALRASAEQLAAQSTGTTFPAVTGGQVKAHRIPVAPSAERRRIVEAIEEEFSRLDAAQTSLRRATRLLRRLRASTLAAAVSGAIIGEDARRWPKKRVADLAKEIRYGTSVKTAPEGAVPVLRMGNVVDGRLMLRDLKHLPRTHHEFPDLLLQPGDVLFNRTNSPELVGKAAVYRGKPSPCSFASYLIRVRVHPGYEPDLLAYFLNSPDGRNWARSVVSQQVGQANINGTKLKALEVPVPREDQQRHIVDEVERHLSVADVLETALLKSVARAEALRNAVLRDAFAGRLVGKDASDKPERNSRGGTGV